jgi:hypothetical protein
MGLGQHAASVKFVIRDRAGQFTASFDAVFTAEGIRILASSPQAPRANAICERIIGTLRRGLFPAPLWPPTFPRSGSSATPILGGLINEYERAA